MSEMKLKPCPFCGGEANKRIAFPLDEDGFEVNMYIVGCNICDVEFTCLWDEEIVVNAWNTRKPIEDIVERLEKIKMNYFFTIANTGDANNDFAYGNVGNALDKAIEIVKGGVEDGKID